MDPLSVTASIITLVGAAEMATKALKKIMTLKGVPALVFALNNEISELRLTLRELEVILANRADSTSLKKYLDSGVQPIIVTARSKLLTLDELIHTRLTKPNGSLDKVAWLRVEDKIVKLQKEIRHIGQKLTTVLGIITSTSIASLETRLDSLHLVTQSNHTATETLIRSNNGLEQAFMQILSMQKAQDVRMGTIEKHLIHGGEKPIHKLEPSASCNDPPPSYSETQHFISDEPRLSALRMRFLQRRRCTPYCGCACHITRRMNTPRMLQFLTGTLFIGYNNVPKLTSACTNSECQKSPEGFVAVSYYFPQWLVARALAVGLHFSDYKSPELLLRTLNVRDPLDELFVATAANDAGTVRMLLEQRKASVVDVQYGTGHSALHIATMQSKIEVIEVLLQYGAEPFLENNTQETAYDMAWNTVLCFEATPNADKWYVSNVKKLYPSTAAMEERRAFSRIHQIVCKLLPLDLETELRKSRHLIDQRDTDGRTALHWAAGRGDYKAVETLLKYGADRNAQDRIEQGPLRSSLKASEPECLQLLVLAGADIMQIDHWGQTCLQASMYYDDPVAFGLPLIEAGIKLNAKDFQGNTALLEAVRRGHPEAVEMLVNHGADVNVQDQHGVSPLLESVAQNCIPAILKLLQSPVIDAAVLDDKKRSILHVAAASANTLTLQILSSFKLYGLDIHAQQYDNATPLDIAEQRQQTQGDGDSSEDDANNNNDNMIDATWIIAFQKLLEHVEQTSSQSPPSPPYKPFKDEEDRFTDYSHTESPTNSVYYDAKPHLNFKHGTGRPSSLVGSLTGSPLASRPGTPLFKRPPDPYM